MKQSVKSTLVLFLICAVMAVLLALTNAFTAPKIQANLEAAANEALLVVMPEGKDFKKMDLSSYTLPATVIEAYSEAGGGYVITITTSGYGSNFIIMCGVSADGKVTGTTCLSSSETLGHEKTYGANFIGKDAAGVDGVDTISGATKTTAAYKNAMKDAINAAIILGGGSVDIRTEEEILAENLATALPEGNGEFTKLFIVEVIEGIDAVYNANNAAGYVYVIGEQFIGVPTGTTPENATVAAAHAILTATTTTEVDLSAYEGLPSALISASKTQTGNYVLNLKGAGYGINGGNEYHPASGEYIYIRVSMTPDGKIIDCLTYAQSETPNIGSACADEKFYSQFVGKTEDTYENIDAIAGATLTTDGYKKAILRAFESVKILEGGAK